MLQVNKKLVFLDKIPNGDSKSIQSAVDFDGKISPTRICQINYSKQPSVDPVMWCNQGNRHLRRELNKDARDLKYKLGAFPDGRLAGSVFYFVAGPKLASLNKFILN